MQQSPEPHDLGFTYRIRKDGRVEIFHRGRLAATLRGHDAEDFAQGVGEEGSAEAQQLMARLTGNYKRGNEPGPASIRGIAGECRVIDFTSITPARQHAAPSTRARGEDVMGPLFKKPNLGTHTTVHVLNAPRSFEPELSALKGIAIKRTVSGSVGFAMAFVVTQAEPCQHEAGKGLHRGRGALDGVPQGHVEEVPVRVQSRLGLARAGRCRIPAGAHGRHRRGLVGLALSSGRTHQDHNRSRRHGHLGGVSPEQFEAAHKVRRQGVH